MADAKNVDDVGNAGGIAGLVVGLIGGAKAGTIAVPIPVAGTFIGAVVGGVLGSGVGRLLAQGLVKVGGAVVQGAKVTTAGVLHTPGSK
jgi:hypothetical protein